MMLATGAGAGVSQEAEPVVAVKAPGGALEEVSGAEYRATIARMQGLVTACRETAAKCDAEAVGRDLRVDGGAYEVRWDWLRVALVKAKDPKTKDREAGLEAVGTRLEEDFGEASGVGASGGGDDAKAARAKANEVLGRKEFRRVEQTSYFAEKLALVGAFLNRMFAGAADLIPQAPWMAAALEWGVLALAATLLLLWVRRMSRLQRMAIAETGGVREVWLRESDNWAERAREEAGRGEWREAVHSLYWSAIVLLEGQKMWRPNRARTPREYVGLLEPESEKQRALGGLTRVLERIWYGLRPATETDYGQAVAMLDRLRVR